MSAVGFRRHRGRRLDAQRAELGGAQGHRHGTGRRSCIHARARRRRCEGVVATAGISQSTADLTQYKVNLQDWLGDGGSGRRPPATSATGSRRTTVTFATTRSTARRRPPWAAAMAQYLGHESALAIAAPSVIGAPARALLSATYVPFGNAAWAWSNAYGWTAAVRDDGGFRLRAGLRRSIARRVDGSGGRSDRLRLGAEQHPWARSTDFNNETKSAARPARGRRP